MFFNYITLLSALLISSVAIFFSVAGLVAIFPAYAWSIIVMGTSLEIGKLVAAVWLHKNYDTSKWWGKHYMAFAVAVLMFITSMGIFGYLSKSHVEQTGAAAESVASVERIKSEIARNTAIIERANLKIKGFSENGSSVDSSLNRQIDKEQARIDTAYTRVQPTIDAQSETIKAEQGNIKAQQDLYNNEIARIAEALKQPGADVKALNKKRNSALWRVRTAASKNEGVKAARKEIASIRAGVKKEIAASQKLIDRLRKRMGKSTEQDIEKLIKAQQDRIGTSNTALDELADKKFQMESAYRKLEAEVGPIKYIAKFIYDEADANLLEKAVTWVIILLISVFDPLAVLLLIATQNAFEEAEEKIKQIAKDLKDQEDRAAQAKEDIKEAKRLEKERVKIEKAAEKEHKALLKEERKAKHELDKLDKELELARLTAAPALTPEGFVPMDEQAIDIPFEVVEPKEYDIMAATEEELNESYKPEPEVSQAPVEEQIEIPEWEEEDDIPEWEEEILDLPSSVDSVDPVDPVINEEPWESLNDLDEINKEIKGRSVYLTKVGDNYINYNGKVFRATALFSAHTELKLDFAKEVKSGISYPLDAEECDMFLRADLLPTQLFRYNGYAWDGIDKNLLEYSAYSSEYIESLIQIVGEGEYNPELLNEAEKQHIESVLTE